MHVRVKTAHGGFAVHCRGTYYCSTGCSMLSVACLRGFSWNLEETKEKRVAMFRKIPRSGAVFSRAGGVALRPDPVLNDV